MRIRISVVSILASFIAAVSLGDKPPRTLHILAFDCIQAQAEQRLADTNFTAKTGIKVVIERHSFADIMRKFDEIAATTNAHFDLVHYHNTWLGALVAAGLLERLDTALYLGTNQPPSAATNMVAESDLLLTATNAALSLAILRPEIAYRIGKYPTRDRDLSQRNFEPFAETPVFGLPWNASAPILVYRVDLVDGAFARVEPSVAEHFNTTIAPNWTNEWVSFRSAASLVQIVHPSVRGVSAHASTNGVLADFLPILWSYGGELWNEERRKADGVLNSASNIKALQSYCNWNLKEPKIAPPEAAAWSEADALKAFAEGKIAIGMFAPRLTPPLADTKQSKVAGRLGYSQLPGWPGYSVIAKPGKDPSAGVTGAIDAFVGEPTLRRATLNISDGIAISAFSKQKQAAWQYLDWLFSRQTQLKLIFEPGATFVSARKDLAAESSAGSPVHRAVAEAFDAGTVRARWNIPEAAQLDAIFARACNLAFSGKKSPKDALDSAAKEIQAILDRSASQ